MCQLVLELPHLTQQPLTFGRGEHELNGWPSVRVTCMYMWWSKSSRPGNSHTNASVLTEMALSTLRLQARNTHIVCPDLCLHQLHCSNIRESFILENEILSTEATHSWLLHAASETANASGHQSPCMWHEAIIIGVSLTKPETAFCTCMCMLGPTTYCKFQMTTIFLCQLAHKLIWVG